MSNSSKDSSKIIDSELFNPNCKSDLMGKTDMGKLTDYYRMKNDNFEKERIDWMAKLEELKMKNEDFHKKEWELRSLTEKITELQASLSEANIALNQERKKVIHYSTEIDNYKCNYHLYNHNSANKRR